MFEGGSIWGNENYRQLQGSFPVIFLSFANIKAAKYKDMEYKIAKVIVKLYEQNNYLLEGNLLSKQERDYYESICPQMGEAMTSGAIHSMTGFM